MTFDIIDLTEEQIKNLTSAQMQLLRTAQVKKNELRVKTDEECAAFFKTVCANGMKHSSLFPHKVVSAEKRFNYETEIIATKKTWQSLTLPKAQTAARDMPLTILCPIPKDTTP